MEEKEKIYENTRIYKLLYGDALSKDPTRFSDERGNAIERDIKLLQRKIKELES